MAIFTGDIMLDLLGLVVSLVVVVYAYFKWSFQYWKRKNIPYLEGSIPYGSVASPSKRLLAEEFDDFYNIGKSKGDSFFYN